MLRKRRQGPRGSYRAIIGSRRGILARLFWTIPDPNRWIIRSLWDVWSRMMDELSSSKSSMFRLSSRPLISMVSQWIQLSSLKRKNFSSNFCKIKESLKMATIPSMRSWTIHPSSWRLCLSYGVASNLLKCMRRPWPPIPICKDSDLQVQISNIQVWEAHRITICLCKLSSKTSWSIRPKVLVLQRQLGWHLTQARSHNPVKHPWAKLHKKSY